MSFFVFWGVSGVISSLFLLWLLVILGLGGGDVPLDVWRSHFSITTTGERGKDVLLSATGATLLVLTSMTETWLEESTGSSNSVRLPLDSGFWAPVSTGSDWLGLSLSERLSDSGDIWDLLSLERGLTPLVIGSSSSSFTLSSSPTETLPDTLSDWSSLSVPSHFSSSSLSSPSSSSSSIRRQNQSEIISYCLCFLLVQEKKCWLC